MAQEGQLRRQKIDDRVPLHDFGAEFRLAFVQLQGLRGDNCPQGFYVCNVSKSLRIHGGQTS